MFVLLISLLTQLVRMNASVSVMPLESSAVQSNPTILDSLHNPLVDEQACPSRTRLQIDLILLAIEALELGSG